MTGFRVALGGACQLYSLDPDLVTLGKIVGGGLPVGVFGGKRDFMDMLAPLGPVYQAGTLSGNPLAMAAGIATVSYLKRHADRNLSQARSHIQSRRLKASPPRPARAGIPLTLNRVGSMGTWFFTPGPVTNYDEAAKSRHRRLRPLPPRHARPRRLAAAFAIRSRIRLRRAHRRRNRRHPRRRA